MKYLVENGELDAISVQLQDEAVEFFSQRNLLKNPGSKKTLQMINYILIN